jgi:DNA-binding transcriptional LysR family regulator
MAYQVTEHIEAGRLTTLLSEFEPEPLPVHLLFHPIPRRNRALRAFVDHSTPRLRAAVKDVSDRLGLPADGSTNARLN